jgi:hypothetical protein
MRAPAAKSQDGAPARAPYIDSSVERTVDEFSVPPGTLTHRLQSVCCVPLGSDVGCASGKNIGCVRTGKKARMRRRCMTA